MLQIDPPVLLLGPLFRRVFGSAPCVQYVYKLNNEVLNHVTNTLVNQVSSDGSESEADWKEPSLFSYNNPRMLQPDVSDKVTFAVHLLQSDACVQVLSCYSKRSFTIEFFKYLPQEIKMHGPTKEEVAEGVLKVFEGASDSEAKLSRQLGTKALVKH